MADPIVKPITCPSCAKPVNVRVIPTATKHTFHCPHCKAIVTGS
jgi:hypothetical protein